MSDPWDDDQHAVGLAAKALPAGFTILWGREDDMFQATLYYLRGTALAESSGPRDTILSSLFEVAGEMARDRCIDLASLPPGPERFTISAEGRAITCWACVRTSYHPKDVLHRYCGACHAFHDEQPWPIAGPG